MSLIYLLVLFIVILVILIFSDDLKVKFMFDTDSDNINLSFIWLYPLLKILIKIENSKPILTIYLFKMRIYKKEAKLKREKNKGTEIIKFVNPKDISVTTSYGFGDPYKTGIVCSVLSIITQFLKVDKITQKPNFVCGQDYIYVNANAKVNVGSTLVNYTKQKINNRER